MIKKSLLTKWLNTKSLLAKTKEKEMSLRKQIVDIITKGHSSPTTHIFETPYGDLTTTLTRNFKIDIDVYNQIERKLKTNELDCIKMHPKLKLKEFKLLDAKSLLRKAVIETPGAPTLKFKLKE